MPINKNLMDLNGNKLARLRKSLQISGTDIFILPCYDLHLGEYVPGHWRIIEWLTGFTGSSATVVVTDSFAGLWTDSRYFIQAERQLSGTGFMTMKPELSSWTGYQDFIRENVEPGMKIGVDGRIFPVRDFRKLKENLKDKDVFIDTECNPVDEIWSARPPLPRAQAFDFPVEFAGKGRDEKISGVRKLMDQQGVDFHLLTSPDDIMWLLNIRGSDLKYSPVLLSFALIGNDQILLFVDESGIPPKTASEFDTSGIVMLPYEETSEIISGVVRGYSVLIDPRTTSVSIFNSLSGASRIMEDITFPARLKAVKNKTEIENIGRVMIRDGVALTRFFHWLENNLGSSALTESSLSSMLEEFRSQQEGYRGPSFAPIIAFNENSALPHYDPSAGTAAEIGDRGIILVDSGGQYAGGTTDITRTIAVGSPTQRQKTDFTLVLKGHINLALAKFPAGTKGCQLDILARRALWESGLNYGHGTGHGIGYYLNVHEGPQGISPLASSAAIESGMLLSNEPAIYREGEYGIRIENIVLCYEDEISEYGCFLRFDTLSLCYIDKSLIELSLLDQREISWLNKYHSEVFHRLSPYLTENERIWLREKTEGI
ncbi:MAG TPA: aminopeptidase P family protein [Bacteroidales bacterium]|nr:aminopeptidase P family protein [Bacteroidales bacterium]